MKKNLYIGGYSILDLADKNVYAQALICANQNKPVLVYDDPLRYYADTIKIDTENDNNVVITKGGKTITINDANAVSSEGEIQAHIYLLTFKNGDYYANLFVDKKFEDYDIDDTSSLTDDDKNYLKSLKGHFISGECLIGANASQSTIDIYVSVYNDILYMLLDSTNITFDLDNPVNQSDDVEIDITCKQLF